MLRYTKMMYVVGTTLYTITIYSSWVDVPTSPLKFPFQVSKHQRVCKR